MVGDAFTLILCAAGICSCYLYYGMLQEEIFFGKRRVDAVFLLVAQTISNVFVAVVWQQLSKAVDKQSSPKQDTKQRAGRLNHILLTLTAFCYFAAMTASNECLHYVSYPTAVLAKSCKLIPTMIMGWLVEGRPYHVEEWVGAACITCGIVVFNISRLHQNDRQDDERGDSLYGLGLLALSLFMDGWMGACQGLLKQERKTAPNEKPVLTRPPTATETMLFVNLYAVAFLFPMALVTGQWSHGMELLRQEGWDGLGRGIALLNLTAACGQIFIFLTITLYSSLVCTTITTTRKFFTILISVIHFGHVFTLVQWCCVLLVFGGLYLGIVSKFTSPTQSPTSKEDHVKRE